MRNKKKKLNITIDNLNIILRLFIEKPYIKIELFITHKSMKILINDFSAGVEYLYDCIKFGSKYPNLLRKKEFLL